MSDYAPSTEMVKVRYAVGHGGLSDDAEDVRAEAFDRWLARVKAEAKAEDLREAIARIETHNGLPVTAENLRWVATHESLARSWIFDVLQGLAALVDPTTPTPTEGDQG